MSIELFAPGALEHLKALHRIDYNTRYSRLLSFVHVANKRRGTMLLVPPDIDPDLHDVLSGRGKDGKTFELIPLLLQVHPEFGSLEGLKIGELNFPLAVKTRQVLHREGFDLSQRRAPMFKLLQPQPTYTRFARSLKVLKHAS